MPYRAVRDIGGYKGAIPSRCPIIVQKYSDIVRKTHWCAEGALAFHQGDEDMRQKSPHRKKKIFRTNTGKEGIIIPQRGHHTRKAKCLQARKVPA